MHALMPAWPRSAPRRFTPRGRLTGLPKLTAHEHRVMLAEESARRVRDREDAIQNSNITGTWAEVVWSNKGDFTAVANTGSEASILGGLNEQPYLPATFFTGPYRIGRTFRVSLKGILSTTGTPTIVFQVRSGTTAGSSVLSGTSIGVTAAITTASSVTNQYWELWLEMTMDVPGVGTGNCTLSGAGLVLSPGGFASPFMYPLEPTLPPTATWTAAIDSSLTQWLNASVTWGAASSSNTITCKSCLLYGWN